MNISVEAAIEEVKELVIDQGIPGDLEYFNYHRNRYSRMASTLFEHLDEGARILDIGSHYLHSSLILRKMGHVVEGMDVSEFWDLEFVSDRGSKFEIVPIIQDDLQHLSATELGDNRYDVILFTEILEHITFNPVNFWKEVHKLLKDDGLIYISTPNSLSAQGFLRALKNLVTFSGIGNGLEMIFSKVTYGHHWKEYSYRELKKYHKTLSDDFSTIVRFYGYQPFDSSTLPNLFWSIVQKIGNATYFFSTDLEALVTVSKSSEPKWKIQSPEY